MFNRGVSLLAPILKAVEKVTVNTHSDIHLN